MLSKTLAISLLEEMRKIRQFEERIIKIYPSDVMATPVHLCIGQEAVSVGVCANLRKEDYIFVTHRSHGHSLAKGMSMKSLMAELYGRKTGCSGGYGGSMHVIDTENGNLGSSSIVGGNIPIGVGAALAIKLRKEDRISVAVFGDGGADEGVFWESINFAALKKLPVMFVCENNMLAITTPQRSRQCVELHEVAKKFMKTWIVDGTDVIKVFTASKEAVEYIRRNNKPAFLECRTKRWMKHHGVERDDLEYNEVNELVDCPIKKIEKMLIERKWLTSIDIAKIITKIELMIDEAIEYAVKSEYPSKNTLLEEV